MNENTAGHEHSPTPLRGVVFLDVDGVIFRGQLMIALARKRGIWTAFRTAVDCLLFDSGRIGLQRLLCGAYRRLRGMPMDEVWAAYRAMPLMPNAEATVQAFRDRGHRVVLLTAGVPDEIVKDLTSRLGADEGAGIHAATRDGRLTGEVAGELAQPSGKEMFARRWLRNAGMGWGQVIAIGDDGNNLPLMRRAGTAVGFRATHAVRREIATLVEDEDLAAALPLAFRQEDPTAFLGMIRRPWYRELFRKSLHIMFSLIPLLAVPFPLTTTLLLIFGMGLYFLSEFWRVNGENIPVVHWLSRNVIRQRERRALAAAPLTLALGTLVALWLFPHKVAMSCILTAAVADSVAAAIGSRWGKTPWPHNPRKTLLGSLAFAGAASICAAIYLPAAQALTLAFVAAAVESFPLEEWDNFIAPVVAGLIVAALRGAGVFPAGGI